MNMVPSAANLGHVCIVSCGHAPDDVRVTHKIGMTLREAGLRVSWVGPEKPRTGKDYGIEFHYYPAGEGRLGRLLHYRAARRLAATVPDVDVYLGVEPDSAQVAVEVARARGAKAIFDIHETYHDEMLDRWAHGVVKRVLGAWVKRRITRICRECDLVTATYQSVLDPYEGVSTPKLLVHNCVPRWFGEGEPAHVLPEGRPHISILHGKAAFTRGTREIVEAAMQASDRLGRTVKIVMFRVFLSDEDERQFARGVEEMKAAEFLDLRERVSYQEMSRIMRTECDLGALMYPRSLGIRGLPNRLFECMATGLPLIGPDYGIEVRRIVDSVKCGMLVDTEQSAAVADAIVRFAQDPEAAREMARRARQAFMDRYNWETEVEPMLQYIRGWTRRDGDQTASAATAGER